MSRIFTVDIGNTAAKGTVFENDSPLESKVVDNCDPDALVALALKYKPSGAAVCSVGGTDAGFAERLRVELDLPVMQLSSSTPLPFEVEYRSGATLGVDRVAAAAGAIHKYGGNILVVDAGTAVTIDVVSGKKYLGGNISPGLRLRFRSLNNFTARLPLVRPKGELPLWGKDTETAIRCGVVRGLVSEIRGAYDEISKEYEDISLVMTGGDAEFLSPLIREAGINCIEDHNLVGLGLVSIYKFNR